MTDAAPHFPGGTSLSLLEIYSDAAPDGLCGGSAHMHLVSTEAYIVISGSGTLQTIDSGGFQETALVPGSVVWFTPGTIHRAVNRGDLRVAVLMSNSGLPEAGDAVLTFPPRYLKDAAAYAEAAAVPAPDGTDAPPLAAARRRDLATAGFALLREALERGDPGPVDEFLQDAARLVRERAAAWPDVIRDGSLRQAEASVARAEALAEGDSAYLSHARVRAFSPSGTEETYGMCGRLSAVRGA